MPYWTIEAVGQATEYYEVEAETEDGAKEIWESGVITQAYYTEVEGSTIKSVKQVP